MCCHADVRRLQNAAIEDRVDLAPAVEVVEREERVQEVLLGLAQMMDGRWITLERVRVILYGVDLDVPERERWRHRVEGMTAG